MVNTLRRWNQPIMVVITVLVIVSFVWWGPNIGKSDRSESTGPKLYGQVMRLEDWQRHGKRVGIYAELDGLYIRMLDPGFQYAMYAQGRHELGSTAVARSVVFDRECEALGITSTEIERQEILESLGGLKEHDMYGRPMGPFDPRAFQSFKERALSPKGFTDNDFDRVFLDGEVRAKKLHELIGRTATMVPEEIRELASRAEMKTDVSYVAFKRTDFKKEVKATEEELKKSYEDTKTLYKTPELRKVRYAAFLLTEPADKPFTTKQRTDAQQKLANSAYDLAVEIKKGKGNFDELAKKAGATVSETKDFFPVNDAPADFSESNAVAEAAFKLTKEQPYSGHVSIDSGSFVLELKEIKAPEQRSFEDAKKQIEDKILTAKAKDAALAKAKEIQLKIAEALKAGKKFAEAVPALNLKVEEFPTFSLMQDPRQNRYTSTIFPATLKLAPGQISEVLTDPGSEDALIVHIDARTPGDEKAVAETGPKLENMFLEGQRDVLVRSWLKDREIAAGMATAFAQAKAE